MSIWFKEYKVADIAHMGDNTMMEALDMELLEIGEDWLSGRMPIGPKTMQPMRLLHGGASAALAETVGSIAAYLVIDPEKYYCVGLSITANHLRPGLKGFANAVARPIRIGKTTHLWDIDIKDDEDKLLCVCRLTMAIIPK